jgi:hypothetical protein
MQQWGGRSFLFEAKRNESSARTELHKPHRDAFLQSLRSRQEILESSRRSHFLAFGRVTGGDADLVFMPYCDVTDKSVQDGCKRPVDVFFREVLRSPHHGLTSAQFAVYAREMARAAADTSRLHSTAAISGLVVNHDGNKLRYVVSNLVPALERVLGPEQSLQARKPRDRGMDR